MTWFRKKAERYIGLTLFYGLVLGARLWPRSGE